MPLKAEESFFFSCSTVAVRLHRSFVPMAMGASLETRPASLNILGSDWTFCHVTEYKILATTVSTFCLAIHYRNGIFLSNRLPQKQFEGDDTHISFHLTAG